MDTREYLHDPEEVLRTIIAGILKNHWTAIPARITKDTDNGHVATAQPTIKREVTNVDGTVTFEDHPEHVDVPIHHLSGGGVTHTLPNKKGDTGTLLTASRNIDAWFQSDGTQIPMDDRMHGPGDSLFLSGIRSIVRRLHQVAKDSSQIRSDDKKNVIDHHPENGTHIKNVDPSTAPASDSFDPFTQATKFFEHLVHPTNGHAHNATDGGTTHAITNTHEAGPKMSAKNGAHVVHAHPSDGVSILSDVAHTITAPHTTVNGDHNINGNHNVSGDASIGGGLSANSASIGSGGISFGGGGSLTSANTGGDLSGAISNARVTSILHVVGANGLPNFTNDAAAAAGGVILGALYRNGSVLMVRVA